VGGNLDILHVDAQPSGGQLSSSQWGTQESTMAQAVWYNEELQAMLADGESIGGWDTEPVFDNTFTGNEGTTDEGGCTFIGGVIMTANGSLVGMVTGAVGGGIGGAIVTGGPGVLPGAAVGAQVGAAAGAAGGALTYVLTCNG